MDSDISSSSPDNSTVKTVYLPGLPVFSNSEEDLALYDKAHAARLDLARKLRAANITITDIDGANPWLKTMAEHDKNAEGFIFTPTVFPPGAPHFLEELSKQWFEFFSLVTGTHVGNPHQFRANGLSKPCIIMNTSDERDNKLTLLDDLAAKGMFSSEPDQIVHDLRLQGNYLDDYETMNDQAVAALKERASIGKDGNATKNALGKYHGQPFESKRDPGERHLFGVVFFGSATTETQSYINASEALAKEIGRRGWRMITGAGNAGCMGAFDRGYYEGGQEFIKAHPTARYSPAHIGITTRKILEFEGLPTHVNQLVITDNIYDRMKVMIKGQRVKEPAERVSDTAKVIFVTPGGTGTLHEFATMMQLLNNGSMMEGRKIVLLNIPVPKKDPVTGEEIAPNPDEQTPVPRFWDMLISIAKTLGFGTRTTLKDGQLVKEDVFEIAHSVDDAVKIADRVYQEWQERHPEFKDYPHPEPITPA